MKRKPIQVSPIKKMYVIAGIFISVFGGIILAVLAINDFKNYHNPYGFGFLTGIVGTLIGLLVARSIKPYIIISAKMLKNYSYISHQIAIGFMGGAMFLGNNLNEEFSTLQTCDKFQVIRLEHEPGSYRQPEINRIVVMRQGKEMSIWCDFHYLANLRPGQDIMICSYKSGLGFDYWRLAQSF